KRMPDLGRIRRTVDPVVFFRKVDPYDARRVVRTRLYGGAAVGLLRVPKEPRIVVEFWISPDAVNLPFADWKRVVLTADCGYIECEEFARAVVRAHRALALADDDTGRLSRRHGEHVGDTQLHSCLAEIRIRIEGAHQFGARVKSFGESFERGRV